MCAWVDVCTCLSAPLPHTKHADTPDVVRDSPARAAKSAVAFATPSEINAQKTESLELVRSQELLQRKRLQDLRQLGELVREGANTTEVQARRDAMERVYQKTLDKNPEHLPTLNEYALLLTVARGEHDAAEELYLAALGINPMHVRTLADYGEYRNACW